MWQRWRFIILFVVLILGFSLNENPFLKLDDLGRDQNGKRYAIAG